MKPAAGLAGRWAGNGFQALGVSWFYARFVFGVGRRKTGGDGPSGDVAHARA